MTSKFEAFEHDQSMVSSNQQKKIPTDNFELISAYLDGELSPTERYQVQQWIDEDPQVKQLYHRLLALQGEIQSLEIPPDQKTVGEVTEQVFQSLDRQRRRRRLLWGGSAIAASCLATITGLIPGLMPSSLRVAESPNSREFSPAVAPEQVMLAVALNKPAINIPKLLDSQTIEGSSPDRNQSRNQI
ncbi:MAG: anti-sigma factor family protein [Waterburya sp.]